MKHDLAVLDNGGGVGEALIDRIAGEPADILFLDEDRHVVDRASGDDIDALVADPSSATALDRESVGEFDIAMVVSREDNRNFLIGQLLRLRETERVIALVNNRNNLEAFADAGIEPVCVSTALATALEDAHQERETTDQRSTVVRDEREAETQDTERSSDNRIRFDGGSRVTGRAQVDNG